MTERLFNFSAGPATMPLPVLEASAKSLVDYQGKGVGIAEVSHRGAEFLAVLEEAQQRCRALMNIPEEYEVMFLQGGATQQFELIPMNFLRSHAEYLVTGTWAKKAIAGGRRYGDARELATSAETNFNQLPTGYTPDASADYLHICSNNTIFGTRFVEFPQHPCLIADMSSEIMGRELDVSQFGMIYAGAQKNLGPAGVVLVIARKSLLEQCNDDIAPIFNYAEHAKADSCLNTAPTFGIYVLLETFRWIEAQGGIAAVEQHNAAKAQLLYDAIDGSDGFYTGSVVVPGDRSHMNVTFTLPDEDLTKAFLAQATEQGLAGLKGHRSVGGVRASIYNAMPMAGIEALVKHMRAFSEQAAAK